MARDIRENLIGAGFTYPQAEEIADFVATGGGGGGGGGAGDNFIYNDATPAAMTSNVNTLQGLINTIQAGAMIYFFKGFLTLSSSNRIYLNAGITIDVEKFGGIIGNNTVLDFSLAPDGTKYFTLNSSRDLAGAHFYSQELCTFRSFQIYGNTTVVGGIRTGTSTAWDIFASYIKFEHILHFQVKNVEVHHDNAYMIKHLFCHGVSCGYALNLPAGVNNGECIGYEGCSYGNSDGFLICDNADAQVNFNNGSIDFVSVGMVVATTGRINISNSNLEANLNFPQIWFTLNAGQAGTLTLSNCTFYGPTNLALPALVQINSNTWRVMIDSPLMQNFKNTADVLVSGFGAQNFSMRNWQTFNVPTRSNMLTDDPDYNTMGDGDFALTTVNTAVPANTSFTDLWSLIDDEAGHPIVSKTDGFNTSLFCTNLIFPAGQTKSLQATFLHGAGTVKSIGVFIPELKPRAQYVVSFQQRDDGALTGDMFVSWRWFQRWFYDSFFVPRWSGKTQIDSTFNALQLTPSSNWATTFRPGTGVFPLTCPNWASGAAIIFQCNNMSTGSIYLGDFVVQKWSD